MPEVAGQGELVVPPKVVEPEVVDPDVDEPDVAEPDVLPWPVVPDVVVVVPVEPDTGVVPMMTGPVASSVWAPIRICT